MGSQFPNLGTDWDWDHPLTDEDLRAIDAAIAAAPPPALLTHRGFACSDNEDTSIDSPPRTRRRLPDSLFVFQQGIKSDKSAFSLAPCYRNRFSRRNYVSCSPALLDVKFGGRIIYSRTMEEVERDSMRLVEFVEAKKREESPCILGLDIEWKPTFRRGVSPGKAAVMQICGENNSCFVFHIIHSQIPRTLQCLLEDPTCQKVGVGIASDGAKVFLDHNVSINNMEDLSDLANRKLVGEAKKWSLSSLTETLICRKLPKPSKIRLGNWEVKVLSKEQLNYAATDAYVSWYLHQVLKTFPDPPDTKTEEMQPTPKSYEIIN